MISEIMVLITPTLPFKTPPRARKHTACGKEVEKPKAMQDRQVPERPINKTDFRPHHSKSASRPHRTAVRNCAAAKLPSKMPAWEEMVDSGRLGLNDFN